MYTISLFFVSESKNKNRKNYCNLYNNIKMSNKKHIQIFDNNANEGIDHDIHHEVKPVMNEGVASSAGKLGKSQGNYIKIM